MYIIYLADVCALCGQRPAVDDRPVDVCFVSGREFAWFGSWPLALASALCLSYCSGPRAFVRAVPVVMTNEKYL